MSQKLYIYIFYVAVLLGLADSIYLSMTVLLGIAPTCGVIHGCETVSRSQYSRLFSIPLAYLGVLYYLFGALLAGYLAESRVAQKIALLYGLAGAGMSLWFIYIQAVLIGAFCIYCLGSALATFIIFGAAIVIFKNRSVVTSAIHT